MIRWKTAAATLIASALVLTACSGGQDEQGGSAGGGDSSLTIGAITPPVTLDSAGAEWGNRAPYYQAVYDTLLYADVNGEIQPWLATEWAYDDDMTELTLTLRDDVTFSDGSALTADVVALNLERFRDGTAPGAGDLAGMESAEAPDDTTVVITLEARDPAFLDYLTRDAGLIASSEAIANGDLETEPVGSGPYLYDAGASVTGTSYAYTANPDYWNPDAQHYEELTIRVFEDPTAALNAIKANEADAVRLSTNDNLEQVEAAGWTVNSNELDFQGLLLLDRAGTDSEALGDVRVRQAINYAIDREAMLEAVQKGHGTVTTQVFPPTSDAYDEALDDAYPYDVERAQELMDEAGYSDGFTISMPQSALLGTSTYALIDQQLAEIGITIDYTDPGNNFIADLLAPKFPASYMALEQNPDWQLVEFMLSPGATFNPYGYEDETASEMMSRIQLGDEAEQAAAAAELNAYIVEQAWFAPFYRVEGIMASAPGTSVEMLPTNAYPSIFDIQPAE
ncbi:ABC transporter substrate-binding protein [Microbacterium karelineae]|uniref:ABC transporter substrate-binding protein n=1 Tax=Microbacterium karelineae TaxID=2654283 RepID=UPI0012EA1408|nr:ABC transporter substrate-binding protein [Microbacterium karelineae]